jgi:multidrug efflux system outer membrane protein
LTLPPEIPAGLPSDLLENRPDIIEAEQRMLAANAQIGAARAAFLPTISLTGINGFRTTSLHKLVTEPSHVLDYTAGVSQPLFTGGRLSGNLQEAKAIYEESVHIYLQTILTALQEVEDALVGHEQAKEKLEIQTREIAALQEYLDLSRLRYNNGQNDYLTVLNAETSLFQVQLLEVNTQADLFLTLINLYKALGQGWD